MQVPLSGPKTNTQNRVTGTELQSKQRYRTWTREIPGSELEGNSMYTRTESERQILGDRNRRAWMGSCGSNCKAGEAGFRDPARWDPR